MHTSYINSWLDNFQRQSLIRRAIVISGNIIDLSFSAMQELKPINQIITETLKKQGFQYVVYYSRVGGISGVSPEQWSDLENIGQQQDDLGGDEYDMGEPSTNHAQQQNVGQRELTPKDFFAVAERVILQSKLKIAFIVDWSNYLFGQIKSLSDAEGHGCNRSRNVSVMLIRTWLQQKWISRKVYSYFYAQVP